MKVSAQETVIAAQQALIDTQARLAMHDTLLSDAAVFQPQIDANLKAAKEKAEAAALAEAKAKAEADAIEAAKP